MKRILIVSDTHGNNENFEAVLEKEGQPDFFVHCGDLEGSEYYFENIMECEKMMVAGNNDFFSGLPRLDTTEFEGIYIGAVHGHRQGVNYSLEGILDLACENGMDVICYGHTHKPGAEYDKDAGVWMVNPGSLSYPRQNGRRPSYAVLEIEVNSKPKIRIEYI